MGSLYYQQVCLTALATLLPLILLSFLLWFRIVPPYIAGLGGALLIALKNFSQDYLVTKYGFANSAVEASAIITIPVMVLLFYCVHKSIIQLEKEKKESKENYESNDPNDNPLERDRGNSDI